MDGIETAFARSLGLRPPVMDGEDPADATEWVRWLRRRCVVKIVPIEVPASREAVEQGSGCMRKTVAGVDLNRNWPVGFQPMSASKRATSDEYPGERPFSEVESRVVRNLARSFAPTATPTSTAESGRCTCRGITRRSLRSPFRRTPPRSSTDSTNTASASSERQGK